MSRYKGFDSKATAAAPGRAPSFNVVGVVAVDGKDKKNVEKEEEEETKEKKGFSAGGRVSPAKVVVISFLGKSPDSRSANARPLSSVKNRRDDGEGQHRCVSSNSRPCLLPKGEEEVKAVTFGEFWEFFWTFGKKNQRLSPDSLLFRARRGWGEERKEFLTTLSPFLVVVPPAYQPHVRHHPITADAASPAGFQLGMRSGSAGFLLNYMLLKCSHFLSLILRGQGVQRSQSCPDTKHYIELNRPQIVTLAATNCV